MWDKKEAAGEIAAERAAAEEGRMKDTSDRGGKEKGAGPDGRKIERR